MDERQEENILGYISRPDRDEVAATSLIRLLRGSDSEKKWPVIIAALQNDPSPLVRAAAAEVLDGHLTDPSLKALIAATQDEFRLVRVRAAAALAAAPAEATEGRWTMDDGAGASRPSSLVPRPSSYDRQALAAATAELEAALSARGDDYIANYNLGNFHIDRREYERAISAFEAAIKLRPDYVPPYVNASLAYNAIGRNAEAEASLKAAIAIDPNSVAAHLNLGMLLAELGRMGDAEEAFRGALSSDPNSAVAAYNLGVILAKGRMPEALRWCGKAATLRPDNPRYVYTYAFYLRQSGSEEQAIAVLRRLTDRQVPYIEAYLLLGDIYEKQRQFSRARDLYSTALNLPGISEQQRYTFAARIRQIESTLRK